MQPSFTEETHRFLHLYVWIHFCVVLVYNTHTLTHTSVSMDINQKSHKTGYHGPRFLRIKLISSSYSVLFSVTLGGAQRCTHKSLPAGSREHMGCLGSNLVPLHAWQIPYPLFYCFRPLLCTLVFFSADHIVYLEHGVFKQAGDGWVLSLVPISLFAIFSLT